MLSYSRALQVLQKLKSRNIREIKTYLSESSSIKWYDTYINKTA